MKIQILRNTVVKGLPVETGQIVDDVPESEARMLIGIRKAEAVQDSTPQPGSVVETADLNLENIQIADVKAPARKKK